MLPDVEEIVLPNGFKALLVERRGLPVVASMLWYRVGSRDERTGETGLSHFLEHMMFKGTDHYAKGEIDHLTGKMGGNNNAFTDNDTTAYFFSLAADRWETALEIEANRMTGCVLDEEEFEAEKRVVLEELAMGEDEPWRVLYQATESLAFQIHPYHHPIIGWKQDVESVDVGAMRGYYRRHYAPNRSYLVAVGDFDRGNIGRRLEGLFGGIPAEGEARRPVLSEPEAAGQRRGVVRSPTSVRRLAVAFKTCRMGEREDFVLDVIAHALATSRSSRLYRRLVLDSGMATYVSALNETRLDPGLFWVLVELRPDADPDRVEAVVWEEIGALGRQGIRAPELRRIRTQVRSSFLFEDETVLDMAMKLGRFEAMCEDGWRLLDGVLDTYDGVTSADVKDVVGRFMEPERATVVWSVPAAAEARSGSRRRKKGAKAARR